MSSDSEYSMNLFLKQPSLLVEGTDPEERTERGEVEDCTVAIFELVSPTI